MRVKPYYEEAGITIYHGDCREILPELSGLNLCLTSPPYNVNLNYPDYDDSLTDAAFKDFAHSWVYLTYLALAERARMYVIVSDKMLWWFKPLAEALGFTWAQLLSWCKPNLASVRIGGDWNAMVEWILLFRKGKRTPMLNGFRVTTHNYLVIPSPQSNWKGEDKKAHPAQWPIDLPLRLLARTPGQRVLDPFCGSGTALLAAKKLGREAIGIDLSERACEIAAKRLSQGVFNFNGKDGR